MLHLSGLIIINDTPISISKWNDRFLGRNRYFLVQMLCQKQKEHEKLLLFIQKHGKFYFIYFELRLALNGLRFKSFIPSVHIYSFLNVIFCIVLVSLKTCSCIALVSLREFASATNRILRRCPASIDRRWQAKLGDSEDMPPGKILKLRSRDSQHFQGFWQSMFFKFFMKIEQNGRERSAVPLDLLNPSPISTTI